MQDVVMVMIGYCTHSIQYILIYVFNIIHILHMILCSGELEMQPWYMVAILYTFYT